MGVHQQDNTHLYFIFRSDQIQRRFKLCTKEDGLIVSSSCSTTSIRFNSHQSWYKYSKSCIYWTKKRWLALDSECKHKSQFAEIAAPSKQLHLSSNIWDHWQLYLPQPLLQQMHTTSYYFWLHSNADESHYWLIVATPAHWLNLLQEKSILVFWLWESQFR